MSNAEQDERIPVMIYLSRIKSERPFECHSSVEIARRRDLHCSGRAILHSIQPRSSQIDCVSGRGVEEKTPVTTLKESIAVFQEGKLSLNRKFRREKNQWKKKKAEGTRGNFET